MEVVRSSETLVLNEKTARRRNPEDLSRHLNRSENFRFDTQFTVWSTHLYCEACETMMNHRFRAGFDIDDLWAGKGGEKVKWTYSMDVPITVGLPDQKVASLAS